MKVQEIRPDDVMIGQRVAMAEDIAWLQQRRDRFEPVPCPACGENRPERLYVKHGMDHARCPACGTQYVTPRPTARMLRDFYVQSANYAYWAKHIFPRSAESRRRDIFEPRAAHAAQVLRKRGLTGGPLIEIGAAYGWFCVAAQKTGVFSGVLAVEPTPELAEICRAQGLEVFEGPYEAIDDAEPATLVAAFEVIEHLHEPKAFMDWCHDVLLPGGCVYLTCPNIAGFETRALGRDSDTVDHEHLNLFRPSSLALLAERCGFVDIEVTTPGQLDVDIVWDALCEGRIGEHRLGPAAAALLRADQNVRDNFQEFLRSNRQSSHMAMVAFKPRAG